MESTGSQPGETLFPRGHVTMSRDIINCDNGGERKVLLASSVFRPRMLPNFLQCTGQPHNREWPGPKCQECQGGDTLAQSL